MTTIVDGIQGMTMDSNRNDKLRWIRPLLQQAIQIRLPVILARPVPTYDMGLKMAISSKRKITELNSSTLIQSPCLGLRAPEKKWDV